jgi:hypothetical protein
MAITNREDPVAKLYQPEAMLRWAMLATEEVAGKQGIAVILREAGLERFIDEYPPEVTKNAGKSQMAEYANLNAALLTFLGRGGPSLANRVGRSGFRMGLEQYGSLLGGAAVAGLRLIPEGQRARVGMEMMKKNFEMVYAHSQNEPIKIVVEDTPEKIFFHNHHCPACAGKHSDTPICYLGSGLLQEGMHWLMGKEYQVTEIACRAQGAPACVYEISKTPKEG